jgi:hypothetical protein
VNAPPDVIVPLPTVEISLVVVIEPKPGTIEPEESAPTEVSVENELVVVSTVPVSSGKVMVRDSVGSSNCHATQL